MQTKTKVGALAVLVFGGLAMVVVIPLLVIVSISGAYVAQASCGNGLEPGPGKDWQWDGPGLGSLSKKQTGRAATVYQVGRSMRIPDKGIVIALAVAFQESGYRSLANDGSSPYLKPDQRGVGRSRSFPNDGVGNNYGSIGIFQQQWPWWGTMKELMDPAKSAEIFYTRLREIDGWESMPPGQAGQAVQQSYDSGGSTYADDLPLARELLAAFDDAAGGQRPPTPKGAQPGSPGPGDNRGGATDRPKTPKAPKQERGKKSPEGPAEGELGAQISTYNVKHVPGNTRVRRDLERLAGNGVSLVSMQETQMITAGKAIPRGWDALQGRGTDKAETAIAWDTSVWSRSGASGWVKAAPSSSNNLTRWIAWAELEHRDTGTIITVTSVHAPARNKAASARLQPGWFREVISFINTRKANLPVIMAGDFNAPVRDQGSDPFKAAAQTGSRWRGQGVDGFLIDPRLRVSRSVGGPQMSSDHDPVTVRLGKADLDVPQSPGQDGEGSGLEGSKNCVTPPPAGTCPPTGLAAEKGLSPDALLVLRCTDQTFGRHTYHGVGSRSNASDHPTGKAVDVMLNADWNTDAGASEGWKMARWMRQNAKALGIKYIIFARKIWSPGRDAEGWRPYGHPSGSSNPTLDHLDHVHASVNGNSGTGMGNTGKVVFPLDPGYYDQDNYGGTGSSWQSTHTGNDFSVACGTPVYAAHAGTVRYDNGQSGWAGPYFVKIETGPKTPATWYAHMQKRSVRDGQKVRPGQRIGDVGTLGNSEGCHLHLEVHSRNGRWGEDDIDPKKWLAEQMRQGPARSPAEQASTPATPAGTAPRRRERRAA